MENKALLLDREDSLLVLIDVQEKLAPAVWDGDRVVDNIARLVKFSGIIQLPVIYTEQEKLGPTLPRIWEELGRKDPIRKIHFDCFGCEEFRDTLNKLGRGQLILAGLEAHICVAQTALSGLEGYRVQVVGDATSSRAKLNWEFSLKRLRQSGVVITTTEMVIYELLKKAGTGEFKSTLPLVK